MITSELDSQSDVVDYPVKFCHFESSEGTMPLTAGELGYGSLGIILRLLCFSASLHVSGLIRVRILVVELHSAKKVTFKS